MANQASKHKPQIDNLGVRVVGKHRRQQGGQDVSGERLWSSLPYRTLPRDMQHKYIIYICSVYSPPRPPLDGRPNPRFPLGGAGTRGDVSGVRRKISDVCRKGDRFRSDGPVASPLLTSWRSPLQVASSQCLGELAVGQSCRAVTYAERKGKEHMAHLRHRKRTVLQ